MSQECAICKDKIQNEADSTWLPCCHGFHSACIQRWVSLNPSCPVCRHKLEKASPPVVITAPQRVSQHLYSLVDLLRAELHNPFYSPVQVDALIYYSSIDDTVQGEITFEPSQIT